MQIHEISAFALVAGCPAVQFSRRMSRVWKLLCWFLLVISPAVVRGAGTASSQKDIPPSDNIVDMDKLVVSAARYHWRYAKSKHFEILSSYADDDFVTRVVQIAELAIKPYEKNLSIYRSNRELPTKLIFIDNNGIGRFFTAIGVTGDHVNPDKKDLHGRYDKVWTYNMSNPEQLVIICTITSQFMDENRWQYGAANERTLEQKAKSYATEILFGYQSNCLDEKNKISGFTIRYLLCLLTDILTGSRPYTITNIQPYINRDTITLTRFNGRDDMNSITSLAKDDYENKLSKYGKRWANTLPLDEPLFNLRDIVESSAAPQQPAKGCSVEDVQKYISFQRQMLGFSCYCAFGPNPETRDALVNLIKCKNKRLPITEEVFKRYFGKSYEEFSNEMDDFYEASFQEGKYTWGNPQIVIDHFDPQAIPKVTWADATRGQSARIISDWFFLHDYPDIARKTLDLAKTDAPYVLNDPEFCAALGLSEMQYGDKATALSLLEKAAGAKVARPEVYRLLSRSYLQNILASKEWDYKLDKTEAQKVFDPLFAALKLWQSNPQTYLQIFELARHTNVSFPKELWKTIADNCAQLFPDNFALLNRLVPLLMKNGLTDEAAILLDATEKCPLTMDEQQQLARLKTMVGGQNPAS